jgi:hypothetical protein
MSEMMLGMICFGGVLLLSGDPPALPRELEDEGPRFSMWARGEYWYALPNGQVVITRGSRPGSGSVVRVGEDLGLEPSSVPGAELGASLGDHRLRLDYLHLSFRGQEELDQALVFHGQSYPAGDPVRAQLDLPRLSLNYDYDVWDTPWTRLRVGIVGHLYWISARLTDATLDEKRAYSRGNVAAAASVDVPLGPLLATLDGSLGYSDSDHDFFGGIRFQVAAKLWGPLEVGAGYRWERMDASAETNRIALTIHGPLVELSVRF